MVNEVQTTLLERLATMGEGMKGVVQRIEVLEQEQVDTIMEDLEEKDDTFDNQIDYLEELLKDRHLELIRRQRAYAESIGEMRRTETYLHELFKAAQAITASISDKVVVPPRPDNSDKVLSEQPQVGEQKRRGKRTWKH